MDKVIRYHTPVECVVVTLDNMDEVAQWCDGEVIELDSRIRPGRKDRCVLVPTSHARGKAKTVKAFPGMAVTERIVFDDRGKDRITFAVFAKDYFKRNFFASPEEALNATMED